MNESFQQPGDNSRAALIKKKIMLIDDEESVLLALRLLMEALGYSVKTCSRGKEALIVLREEAEFDYILCDLKMPEMNGLETLQKIKEIRPEVKRVLISAHATTEEVEQARQIGIFGFLGKPFTVEELKDLLAS